MHKGRSFSRYKIRHSWAIAASLAALTAAADAQSLASIPTLQLQPRATAAVAAGPDAVLRRLPASAEELTFRGESDGRSFVLQLSRIEAARAKVFQIALLNAVSTLPERSTLRVAVNGTVIGAVQENSSEKPSVIALAIPPGVLVPGRNTVRISATMTHRVDCSIAATYELWAALDPAQTGFMVPREAASAIRSLDDLGLEPLAPDGTTRIHLRMVDDPDPVDLAQAGHLINALVRRAGLVRPIVDVGPDHGVGPGVDVVIGRPPASSSNTALATPGNGITIARDAETNRPVVWLGAPGAAETDHAIAAIEASPRGGNASTGQGFRKTFADFGRPTEVFAGRHYVSTLGIDLPFDFLAANDRARLYIDGSHSGTLIEGSTLVFRVNGTLVSSMPLEAGKVERFQHASVELPLRFFHPGHNELSIEGMTSAVADAQCDTTSMSREPRLTIAGSSEIEFPGFAHLATLPQIPAAMAQVAGTAEPLRLYLPSLDRNLAGAGLTVLANVAVNRSVDAGVEIRIGAPSLDDAPGIVVAPFDQLPDPLLSAVRQFVGRDDVNAAPGVPSEEAVPGGAATGGDPGVEAEARTTTGVDMALDVDTLRSKARTVASSAITLLRDHGFFFTTGQRADLLPPSPGALVVAAIEPQASALTIAGINLPQVLRDQTQWLVIAAADQPAVTQGIQRLAASGHWSNLSGAAASFDPQTEALHIVQPTSVSYVLPQQLTISEIRPILGGVMSDNIGLALAVLFTLMALLGLSTHVLIRRMGVR